jgi:hypothetical protein
MWVTRRFHHRLMTRTLSHEALLIASAFLACSATVQAQSADARRVDEALGKAVRIIHVDGSRTTGTLVSFPTDEIVLRQHDRERRVGLMNVDRQSVGRIGTTIFCS